MSCVSVIHSIIKYRLIYLDTPAAIGQDSENSSSDSDEALEDSWSSKCKEKAKWLQENAVSYCY